jgi:hypothetical protein
MKSLEINKPIHMAKRVGLVIRIFIWDEGSKATDEYKEGLYYQLLREWTNNAGISCFFTLRLLMNSGKMLKPLGSDHFGLFTQDKQNMRCGILLTRFI